MNLQQILTRLTLYVEYQTFVFEQLEFLCLPHREQDKICEGKLINLYARYKRYTFNEWLNEMGYEDLTNCEDTNLDLNAYVKR